MTLRLGGKSEALLVFPMHPSSRFLVNEAALGMLSRRICLP